MKPKVLFICSHNSARSQLAEELLRKYGGNTYTVFSAGLEKGTINPYIKKVLKDTENIDISGKQMTSVWDLLEQGGVYSYVITVCGRETDEKCPIFPGVQRRVNWPFLDPEGFTGTDEEILEQVIQLKEELKEKIFAFFQL